MSYKVSIGYVIHLAILAGVLFAGLCHAAETAVSIGTETQLVVDDVMLAHKQGVERTTHACEKLDQPVLTADKPWERTDIDRRIYVYGTVLPQEDGSGYRMWYMRFPDVLHYALSEDGVHWERPNLGLAEFDGSTDNNRLGFRMHSPSIVRDPNPDDPGKLYKMLGYYNHEGTRGYCVAYSADGLRWNRYEKNPVLPSGDTCTLAYDPETDEFLAFHKRNAQIRGEMRRLVYLAVSKDMQTWSEPKLVMAPDEIDDAQTKAEGGINSQFYNMSAFRYGSQWLGLVTHFRYMGAPPEEGPQQSGHDGPIDVQLVHSRDGRSWKRLEDRSPVIPNGPHAYDAGCILGVTNTPVVTDDEVWTYYTAITTTHGGYIPKKQISIARAAWRLDGWCSLRAGEEPGVVETVALRPEGSALVVNAAASGGSLTVAVLDPSGNPIPGYSDTDCVPLQGDGVRQPVRWKEHTNLPSGQPIRLRFTLQNADLFSYGVE